MDKIFQHTLGQAIRINDSFNIVVIPKNGSCTIQNLPNSHRINFLDLKHKDEKFYVIIRDPVERWKSGIKQYIMNWALLETPENENIDKSLVHSIFYKLFPAILTSSDVSFTADEHTARQTDFIKHLVNNKYENVTYIPFVKHTSIDKILELEKTDLLYDLYQSENNLVNDLHEESVSDSLSSDVHQSIRGMIDDYVYMFNNSQLEKYFSIDMKYYTIAKENE